MLHHIEIYVANIKKTSIFWNWLLTELGYESYQKWESGISFKYKGTYIVFVQVEERFANNSYHRCNIGLNHLAFHAISREHVDEMTLKLQEKEVRILYLDKHPYAGGENYYAVFFEDPDRIKVELVAP